MPTVCVCIYVSQETETYDADDVAQMSNAKLQSIPGEAFDVDPAELEFPFSHHATVDAKLRTLGRKGVITPEEKREVYDRHTSGSA